MLEKLIKVLKPTIYIVVTTETETPYMPTIKGIYFDEWEALTAYSKVEAESKWFLTTTLGRKK